MSGYYSPERLKSPQPREAHSTLEVASFSGLEVDSRCSNGKEAVINTGAAGASYRHSRSAPGERGWWRTRNIVFCVIAAILIATAVFVPVGVLVLSQRGSEKNGSMDQPAGDETSSPQPQPSSPASTPNGPTRDGVFLGTRLAAVDARTGRDVFLFYQYGDYSLRYTALSAARDWQGSRALPVKDAMPGTPLGSTFTIIDGITLWWLFYVDKSSIIQSIYSREDPANWHVGNVGSKRYTVPKQSSIAFTVSSGSMYDPERNQLGGGLALIASTADGQVQEYIYNGRDESWSEGVIFTNADGYGGASVWSQQNFAHLFTLNKAQSIDFWWRDYKKPEESWQLGPSSHAAVMENASMCGQFSFTYVGSNGKIWGSNFTSLSEPKNARWGTTYEISDVPAIEGSALSCWYYFPHRHPENTMFHTFYQAKTGKLIEARRYWEADNMTVPGTWRYIELPIR
ncbi:hypothetical protein GX50_01835 [[Emmonsia] crescens]|uniref:Fucose-specific lectin n=1 Tax=[Emmonsia] crescens TaxID=73230 RepID=A0A2B7ZPT5_9EURO|nr:hypothetical protein GX50_01835 [Emmonsia crescens]